MFLLAFASVDSTTRRNLKGKLITYKEKPNAAWQAYSQKKVRQDLSLPRSRLDYQDLSSLTIYGERELRSGQQLHSNCLNQGKVFNVKSVMGSALLYQNILVFTTSLLPYSLLL